MMLTVRPDRSLVRAAGKSTRNVLVSFTAPEVPRKANRRSANVAMVLDRSGSMGGDKIRLARDAVRQGLQLLRADDRFALVAYDNEIDLVVESVPASAEAKRNALAKLAQIDARGSTDLGGGWLRGCEQVAAHLDPASVARSLLLTDGLANQGITDHDELVRHATELKARGVATSTFGVGHDFDERLLQRMADAGGGHFYFIQTAQQIPDFLTSELGEALEVVARSAGLALRLPAGVEAAPLTRLDHVNTDGGVRVDLGDLVSGQEVSAVIVLTFPAGAEGSGVDVRFSLTDRDGALAAPPQDVTWKFASHHDNDAQPRDRVVDRAVADLRAALAREQALDLNRLGRFDEARQVLEAIAVLIRKHAGDDSELQAIATTLATDQEVFAACMSPVAMKAQHFASYSTQRMRAPDGKAKRKGHK
jgi:Ca-activated chloride channel family protein